MAVLVHIDDRSFTVHPDTSTAELTQRIQDAAEAQATFTFNAVIGEAPLTVWVNTTTVRTIVLDPNGAGVGFFHG
jgi:hypothetical protein